MKLPYSWSDEELPKYIFEPQPDITTYELVLRVKLLGMRGINQLLAYADAPESVRRHFRQLP